MPFFCSTFPTAKNGSTSPREPIDKSSCGGSVEEEAYGAQRSHPEPMATDSGLPPRKGRVVLSFAGQTRRFNSLRD